MSQPADVVAAALVLVHDRRLAPGYGLGLMIGGVAGDATISGHTGGGPGSGVAVYHLLPPGQARTAAAFALDEDPTGVETRCVSALTYSPARKVR